MLTSMLVDSPLAALLRTYGGLLHEVSARDSRVRATLTEARAT